MAKPSGYQDAQGRPVSVATRAKKGQAPVNPPEQAPTEVISLWEAAKRLGLHDRGTGRPSNWTPFLVALCRRGCLDVRYDDNQIPLILSTTLDALGTLVQRHFGRQRMWPVKGKTDPRKLRASSA